ncbi:MAG: hypothetical protein MUC61_03820 [Amoebophilaceae bacterium]|nr:hypothetical protein [Amoebophilaceae bacterium]
MEKKRVTILPMKDSLETIAEIIATYRVPSGWQQYPSVVAQGSHEPNQHT